MEYVVACMGEYALITLTYSFLRTEWPDQYFSVSDVVSRAQSITARSYVFFRLAPVLLVVVVAAGMLQRQGAPYDWKLFAACASPGIGHAIRTHGWAIARRRLGARFGRTQELIYHGISLMMVVVVSVGAVMISRASWVRPAIPSPGGLVDGVWTAVLAALFSVAAVRVMRPRPTDDHTAVMDAVAKLDPNLLTYLRGRCQETGTDFRLAEAIMVVEAIQRPVWVRRVERLLGRAFRLRLSYGIMQVRSGRPLSDRQSVDSALGGPLRGVRLPASEYGWWPADQLAATLDNYNSDPTFLHWVSTALGVLRERHKA